MRTVGEITRYNRALTWADAPNDLSYVVVDGVTADSTGEHQSLALFRWAEDQTRWSIPKTTPGIGMAHALDPRGQLLVYGFESPDQRKAVKLPDGMTDGTLADFRACSPRAELLVRQRDSTGSDRPSYSIVRRGSDVPLLTFGADAFFRVGGIFAFSPEGRSLAWSHEDGTVVLADLDRLNEQLSRFSLGWKEEGR
jgi:hypothetical protein